MQEKASHVFKHYQKLQECLTELMEPGFDSHTRSFVFILLNQTYTNLERLFELVEESTSLSKPRQAILAKLAHHIENTKEKGIARDFLEFIQTELFLSLSFIKEIFVGEFSLAS